MRWLKRRRKEAREAVAVVAVLADAAAKVDALDLFAGVSGRASKEVVLKFDDRSYLLTVQRLTSDDAKAS